MSEEITKTASALRALLIEQERVNAEVARLRQEIADHMRRENLSSLRLSGLEFSWRRNAPSRRFQWSRAEKDHPELYSWLLDNGLVKVVQPKTEFSLVVRRMVI